MWASLIWGGFFYKKFREHFKINPQEYRNGFFSKIVFDISRIFQYNIIL